LIRALNLSMLLLLLQSAYLKLFAFDVANK